MDEIRVLSPTAILGYGYPLASLEAGLAYEPHVIAVDGGSTDAGPYFLGMGADRAGELAGFRQALERDLTPILRAALARDIPFIMGSAGGAGGNLHVMAVALLIRRIAEREGMSFRMAIIPAEVDKGLVKSRLFEGRTEPLGPAPELTSETIDRSVRIVAQMGVEPYMRALEEGAEVIVGGRASDPAMFAALPLVMGFDKGLALHMGKVLECGAIAAEPGSGGDVLVGTLRHDYFLAEPAARERRCTVRSVASHSLYEACDPWRLEEPGGTVDLAEVSFLQETERSVRVSGSRFFPAPVYKLKLEGAELSGYRTVCMAGVRDPSVLANLDRILEEARKRAHEQFGLGKETGREVHFRVYGKDGVMGALEPSGRSCHEAGLFIEAVAGTQEEVTSLCMFAHKTITRSILDLSKMSNAS
ncbi:MAG: acyclic terpene utilization AtuA family protein [bacterium]